MFNVYKLSCNKTGQDYYGSTEETVEERLQNHKKDYKSYLKGTQDYCSSYEIIKNNDYKIEWLEECDDKIHMRDRENLYIDNFPCINIRRAAVPGRTRKEYRETFKEEIAEKDKARYEKNKETILEKRKEYYEIFKEEILEYQKEYREEHKEEISERKKKKFTCPCGSTLRKDDKARHEKTIKHKKYLETL